MNNNTNESVNCSRNFWIVFALAVITFVIRWKVGIWLLPVEAIASSPWMFGFETGHIAANLAAGHGLSLITPAGTFISTAWVSPLYPLFLSTVFKLWGFYSADAATAVVIFHSVFHAIIAACIYLLGVTLSSRRVGLIAVFLYVANPNVWQFFGWAWPTQLYSMLLILHLFVLVRFQLTTYTSAVLISVTLALALLADGAAITIVPITFLHLFFIYKRNGQWRYPLVAFIVFIVLLLPWTIRNYKQFNVANPLRGNVGVNLWVGNNPNNRVEAFHGLALSPWHHPKERALMFAQGEKGYDAYCFKRAINRIKSEPVRMIEDTVIRFTGYWFGEWWTHYEHIQWYYSFGIVLYSILAAIGIWRARRMPIMIFVMVLLLFPVPYYLTVHGHGRYRAPVEPIICLIGALAFHRRQD